jgi:polyhydroxyalkanoate synthesis regulator phasin
MFTLGIPISQFRRADNVLSHDGSEVIDFEVKKQDDDFYMFYFPKIDEYDFKKIVMLLKRNGVTTLGADEQLTERKIMKLVDLITEMPKIKEDKGKNIIDDLKAILKIWDTKEYNTDQERWQEYHMDIQELIEDYEEEEVIDRPDIPSNLREAKNKVRKTLKKLMQ